MLEEKMPTVALVGRTNVGKSTLFNRLTETHAAMVSDIAGTTRDRKEGICEWRGRSIRIVDTGGIEQKDNSGFEEMIKQQTQEAMRRADLILFIVDLKQSPLPADYKIAQELSKSKRPVLVVGNKADTSSYYAQVENQEWKLKGLSAPLPISAIKGAGVGDLLDTMLDLLPKTTSQFETEKPIQVAMIGKPNVGKSSLLNAILGEERCITSPIPHTTREPNNIRMTCDGRSYVFIDTAGIRKMQKVKKTGGLEKTGVQRSEAAIRKADVVLFVIDSTEPIGGQERTLAGIIKEANAGVIILENKWDLIKDKAPETINEYAEGIYASLPFLTFAPILFVSAKTGQRVHNVFSVINEVEKNRHTFIPEKDLDNFLQAAIRQHLPSRGKGPGPPTVLGIKQVGTAPPYFKLFIKSRRADVLHPSYIRFLENRLRERFDFFGTPINIGVKAVNSL